MADLSYLGFFRGGRIKNNEQEAQLSHRDRAMLLVIEYFVKSLKVILNGILEKGVSP